MKYLDAFICKFVAGTGANSLIGIPNLANRHSAKTVEMTSGKLWRFLNVLTQPKEGRLLANRLMIPPLSSRALTTSSSSTAVTRLPDCDLLEIHSAKYFSSSRVRNSLFPFLLAFDKSTAIFPCTFQNVFNSVPRNTELFTNYCSWIISPV